MTKSMRTLKKSTKRSRKYRKKQVSFRRGGEEEKSLTAEVLTTEEKDEMTGFEKVITAFLEKEKTSPTLKYAMNKTNFEKYIKNDFKDDREKYELMRDLTHLIIKDDAHDLFFDTKAASFKVLIKKILEYLTTFVGVDHDITVDYYVKSLVNDKPFVRVNHVVQGYKTIHDVHNMLAYIQNEYTKKSEIKPSDTKKIMIFNSK